MKRSIVAMAFALAGAQAMAQPAPPDSRNGQALELAQKLGNEQSAEGLETIVKTRNWDLLAAYVRGLTQAGMRLSEKPGYKPTTISREIEAIVLRYYDDDDAGPRLWRLCSTSNSWFRCQSRELFDRMLAEYRSGKARNRGEGLFDAIIRSAAPGADAALTRWITAPDAPKGEWLNSLISQLTARKYAPAVPAISAILDSQPPGKPGNTVFALGLIQTRESADALLSRLTVLKRAPVTPEIVAESKSIGMALAQFPPEVPISYAKLRAVLPDDVREFAATWLSKRQDLDAVPDALVLMGDKSTYPGAISALLATDSPEVWKQARAAAENYHKEGRMGDGEYGYCVSSLDPKIANPGKVAAERAAAKKGQEFQANLNLLNRDLEEGRKAKATNPDRYVAAMREYLDAAGKLAADYPDSFEAKNLERNSLSNMRIELGSFIRFRQKLPRDAIKVYETAREKGSEIAGFAIADTLQFDLHDTKGALAEYRKLVKTLPVYPPGSAEGDAAAMEAWGQRWLAAQIAWLESSKKFSGALKGEDMFIVAFLMVGPGPNDTFDLMPLMRAISPQAKPDDRADAVRKLNALPNSALALQASSLFIPLLPDADAMLAFLARQDPAGFATAAYFALIDVAEQNGAEGVAGLGVPLANTDALRQAKARFIKEHRIDLAEVRKMARDRR